MEHTLLIMVLVVGFLCFLSSGLKFDTETPRLDFMKLGLACWALALVVVNI